MDKEPDHNPRRALGKGLTALLPSRPIVIRGPDAADPTSKAPKFVLPPGFDDFQNIPVDQIKAGSDQPRETFDSDSLVELTQSITTHGLLQPITVQRHPDGTYGIIAGERRWRACKMAGYTSIPALVKSVEDSKGLELALIENIQREDLNAIDIAVAFQRLASDYGLSHEQIAERTGKDRSTVTNFLRLLRLGSFARDELKKGTISVGHARALLTVTEEPMQNVACSQIIRKKMSVRETEIYVKRITQEKLDYDAGIQKEPSPSMDPNVRAALDDMAMALGTKVNLTSKKLEIEYYSQEDLDRIYSVIVGE